MVIYNKDVQRLTGKSYRSACRQMNTIRKKLGKQKHQMITVKEYCDYTGLSEEDVLRQLADHAH